MDRIAIDIFGYDDFRNYIKDYYELNNSNDPRFSYQFLADRGGFENRVLVYRIIENKVRRLSAEYCVKFSKAFGHTPQEAEYFGCLFDLDQIKNEDKRRALKKKMQELRDRHNVKVRMIRKDRDHETFYAELYHSVIRALIGIMPPFKAEYEELCRLMLLPVTEVQARDSIELLERIGFVERNDEGIYQIKSEENIRTGREYSQKDKDALNLKYLDAVRILIQQHTSSTAKIFRSKVVGISGQTYDEICRMTEEFSNKIDSLVQNEKASDRVYFYQLSFIPLTRSDGPGPSG